MISHEHRCVFVHIPKVAGQSIETYFLSALGLDWASRAPLLLRPRCSVDPVEAPDVLAHLTASDYTRWKYISEELFRSYFSFSFVRDPFSRVVSMYRYLGYERVCTFGDFVQRILPGRLWVSMYYFVRPQHEFVMAADGRVLVDYIGKLERIDDDFASVARSLGFDRGELPRVNVSDNSGARTGRTPVVRRVFEGRRLTAPRKADHWKKYYTPSIVSAVVELYGGDFEAFGYDREVLSG